MLPERSLRVLVPLTRAARRLLPLQGATEAVEMILVDFVVPIRLVSEANISEHWAKKGARVKAVRQAVFLYGHRHFPAPLPAVVTMIRIAPRQLDDDNAVRSCKAVRDELASLMGINDNDPRVVWRVEQARGAPNQYGVRVRIEVTE